MIVAFDSNAFIWGFKKVCSEGQEHLIEKTTALIQQLEKDNATIIIPTPVLAECMVPVPSIHRPSIISQLSKIVRILPFDYASAMKFAELRHKFLTSDELRQYQSDHKIPKEKIKVDYMIASICIVNKAECIYTHNEKDFTKFVDGEILIKDIPSIPTQTKLSL